MVRIIRLSVVLGLLVAALPSPVSAQGSDLDAFMQRVLDRRDDNWKKLQQYVLDEREESELIGPAGFRLWGDRRDYTWFIRDGVFLRSPVRANGVAVSEEERRKYEDEFARQARKREEADEGKGDVVSGTQRPPDRAPASTEAILTGARQPQFIDSAYFLRFKFEPGRYALVGKETFEGRDVLRIEYYPERLFSHEQDDQDERRAEQRDDPSEDIEASMERMMNKVSMVTLWVEPEAHQILKYTFDNVELDFLPAAWLVRVTDARATMTMSEPFPDVWLPRGVEMQFGAMLAIGNVDFRYRVAYHGYREAVTSGRLVAPVAPVAP
jgi:hypothetical protein